MRPAVEFFLFVLVLSAASVAAGWVLTFGLTPERRRPQLRPPAAALVRQRARWCR